jgi:hypothetical protein
MKKQIKITGTVIKELTGIDIAKYLISIGPYKEEKKEENKTC